MAEDTGVILGDQIQRPHTGPHQIAAGRELRRTHFRESRGIEVDFIEPTTDRILMVDKRANEKIEKQLVYGGSEAFVRSGVRVVPWNAL